ncbi:MAG: DUF4251 domain-containing protein [Bacteroidales bacterium]|nr:DUF4251 domain-containing protein [Bacteroidales bacterium]
MKKLLMVWVIALMATAIQGQNVLGHGKTGGKLTRQERKALRIKREKEHEMEISRLVTDTLLVLEADRLIKKDGTSELVDPNLNFIGLIKNKAVIQTGSNSNIGPNGVGGATFYGHITKLEVKNTGKKGYRLIKATISTNVGFYRVELRVAPGGNTTAMVTNNRGARVQYRGSLVAPEKSRVYEGQITY